MSDEKPPLPGADFVEDSFSQKYKKLAHKPKTWLTRLLVVVVPAAVTAYGSYSKSRVEAENGYKTLAVEVQHQGDAIKEIQADNAEWRKLLVQALLKGGTAAPVPVVPVMASPPPPAHSGAGYGGSGGSSRIPAPPPTPVVAARLPTPQQAVQAELKKLADRPMPAMAPRKVPDFDAAQHQKGQQAY